MDKRTPFRASLIAAALASVPSIAAAVTASSGAEAYEPHQPAAPLPVGYVTGNHGAIARSNTGDCIKSNIGVAYVTPACGSVVAVMPAPVAAQPEQPREIPLKRITLDTDTTFNFDSAQLTEEGKDQLDNVVEAAKSEEVARLRIHVSGYADRIGPSEYNKGLSEERAEAVRQYFVDEGVPAEVITAEGRGEANPVVQCEGMKGVSLIECLRPNRRSEVEFAALERAEPSASEQAPAGEAPSPWAPGTDTGTPQ